ncbi:MAG: NUDIX domain-containing protein [Oscillospiraceae bacterium]|nr:NUDIX domain-containing protein [Oscillospiraceae bacterium]
MYHKSAGVIVFRRGGSGIEYLLLFQSKSKSWSFPKGHAEPFETERQTALRELYEETGLELSLIEGFREVLSYPISTDIVGSKIVALFLAEAHADIVSLESAMEDYRWVDGFTACALLGNAEYAPILLRAEEAVLRCP